MNTENNKWTWQDIGEVLLVPFVSVVIIASLIGGLMYFLNYPKKNYYYVCLAKISSDDYMVLRDNDKCATELMTLRLERVD